MSRDRLAAVDDDVEAERRREAEEESAQERDAARARSRTLLARQFPFATGPRAALDEEAADEESISPPQVDVFSLLSASRQAAPAQRAAQQKTKKRNRPNRDPGFEQVSRAGLREGHAPSTVVLPEAVDQGLDDAAARAGEGERYKEQGGNILRNYDGSYEARQAEEGNHNTFEPDYNDVGMTEELVGVMHTHRTYDDEPSTFSHADFASLTAEGQPLNFLRSGEMTFMIARTREFDQLVAKYEAMEKLDELERRIFDCWENVYDRTKGRHSEKLEAATLAVCKEFHLVYYKGEGRELKRVSPRPADEEREP